MFSNIVTTILTHLKYHMYVSKISVELNSSGENLREFYIVGVH